MSRFDPHRFAGVGVRTWAALALCAVLAACASTAPMGTAARAGRASDAADAAVDDSLPDTVLPITQQLIRDQNAQRSARNGQELGVLLSEPSPYRIGPGDVLSIIVWDHPELANNEQPGAARGEPNRGGTVPQGFVVDYSGQIQFPFAGKIAVAGLTEQQAQGLLVKRLVNFVHKPNITLRVAAYRSKRVYVDGDVKSPGLLPIDDIPMTLLEGLNRAGGMLPTADQSRIVVNRGGASYQINLHEMLGSAARLDRILLVDGDVVRVMPREESKIFISGEVVSPKSLTMHNGVLTLNEALGEAGGINPLSGDASQVYVVRRHGAKPVVYRLDAQAPGALAVAEGFMLSPKDVVYVAATPLTNWQRTISLILPGALSSAVGASGAR